jgi:hypothetical protein
VYKEDGSDINLAICTSWYLDVAGVKRLYKSLNMNDSYAPQYTIWVDGPFTFFRLKDRLTPPLSDDGSREYLQKQIKTIIIDHQGSEVEKRTAYLRKAEELGCDAIIVIDSDEYLHPEYRNWKEFRWWLARYANSHDPYGYGMIFNMMSWIDKDYVKAYNTTEVDEFTLVPRVWHSPKNLEYYNGVHYWVRRKNSDIVGERLGTTILTIQHGIRIAQDSKLRSSEMLEARDNCNKNNIKHEDTLIKRYNTAHNMPYTSIYKSVFGDDEVYVPKTINPLLAVTVNHYIPEILDNLKKIVNVDKIYLDGFEDRWTALNKAREFFLSHEEYSHLILTSDLLRLQRSDINKLISKLQYFDIISGYSEWHKNEATFCMNEVHFESKKRKFNRVDLRWDADTYINDYGLIEAKYTDLYFIGITRKIIEKYEFEKYKQDIGFCWDVTHAGYQILVDPKIYVPMVNLAYAQQTQTSCNPTLVFEKRHVGIDDFMK